MNKLQFRVWDKRNKEWNWTYALALHSSGELYSHPGCLNQTDNYEITLATGWVDIAGKMVYQGDMVIIRGSEYYSNDSVTLEDEDWEFKGKVEFNSFMWLVQDSDKTWFPFCDILMNGFSIEVVGNIYEEKK